MKLRPVYQISLFSPPDDAQCLKSAISRAGGARYGNYSEVFWTSGPGREQFTPLAGAAPTVGELHKTSDLDSVQIVFCIPRDAELLERVLEAVQEAHSWEEPVIFVSECMATAVAGASA